jgi:hypothetical protein
MTDDEHRVRHKKLHRALDELCADWIDQQPLESNKSFSNTSLIELMEWSYQQTIAPTTK